MAMSFGEDKFFDFFLLSSFCGLSCGAILFNPIGEMGGCMLVEVGTRTFGCTEEDGISSATGADIGGTVVEENFHDR